ncbi:hypothetical protein BC829DRAFT_419363 [Chytridium lagenaria]|nr:hypothetical protein BC829DRAFT_419363 [Chytridium lagenaria]
MTRLRRVGDGAGQWTCWADRGLVLLWRKRWKGKVGERFGEGVGGVRGVVKDAEGKGEVEVVGLALFNIASVLLILERPLAAIRILRGPLFQWDTVFQSRGKSVDASDDVVWVRNMLSSVLNVKKGSLTSVEESTVDEPVVVVPQFVSAMTALIPKRPSGDVVAHIPARGSSRIPVESKPIDSPKRVASPSHTTKITELIEILRILADRYAGNTASGHGTNYSFMPRFILPHVDAVVVESGKQSPLLAQRRLAEQRWNGHRRMPSYEDRSSSPASSPSPQRRGVSPPPPSPLEASAPPMPPLPSHSPSGSPSRNPVTPPKNSPIPKFRITTRPIILLNLIPRLAVNAKTLPNAFLTNAVCITDVHSVIKGFGGKNAFAHPNPHRAEARRWIGLSAAEHGGKGLGGGFNVHTPALQQLVGVVAGRWDEVLGGVAVEAGLLGFVP